MAEEAVTICGCRLWLPFQRNSPRTFKNDALNASKREREADGGKVQESRKMS